MAAKKKMDVVRVGIVGCGGIAGGKHMPSLKKLPNVEIVSFFDIISEKAAEAAKNFGIKGAQVCGNYKEMLMDKSVDVIHVCTPNKSHGDLAVLALEAGKHVMCEKPMAKTSVDARKMVQAAKRTRKKLTIGYQNRFRADSLFLNKICRDGDLGDIYYAKAHAIRRRAVPTWGVFLNEEEQGGGPLIDIGTHALDLTLWMMNNYRPKSVMGSVYHKLGGRKNSANAWGPWDPKKYTVEDSAFGFITMENGATIMLESSWAINYLQVGEAMTTLCGTDGGADMWDGLRVNGEKHSKLFVNKVEMSTGGVDFYDGSKDNASDREARTWIDCIVNDTEPLVKPEEALVVTEILEAIYKSAKTGKPVFFK